MKKDFALKINNGDEVDKTYLKHILSELKNHDLDIKWCNSQDLTYYPDDYKLDGVNFLLFYKGELGLSRAPSVTSLSLNKIPVTWTCPHLGNFTLYFDSRFIDAIAEYVSDDTKQTTNQKQYSLSKWNNKCKACGAPAYDSGFTVECSNKCGGCY